MWAEIERDADLEYDRDAFREKVQPGGGMHPSCRTHESFVLDFVDFGLKKQPDPGGRSVAARTL